jgi:hypothetical protein
VAFEFFLHLTFATPNPLNRLAQENPSEVLTYAVRPEGAFHQRRKVR